jgi:hypothetical protein
VGFVKFGLLTPAETKFALGALGMIGLSAVAGLSLFLLGNTTGSEPATEVAIVAETALLPVAPTVPAPETAVVTAPSAAPVPPPSSRADLARALQAELNRTGCYRGDLNGQWSPETREAMKAFTARVNAQLPVDEPDQILLSLVNGHQKPVCADGEAEIAAAVPSRLLCRPSNLKPLRRQQHPRNCASRC